MKSKLELYSLFTIQTIVEYWKIPLRDQGFTQLLFQNGTWLLFNYLLKYDKM